MYSMKFKNMNNTQG